MSTVEQLLAGLIAQLEAQKSKAEGNPLPTFGDLQSLAAEKDAAAVCEDNEEFGNIGSAKAFTTEQLFQRRKKNESASQAQQAFSVSVLYFFFFLVVVRCTQSHDQLSLMPSCVLGFRENYKWHEGSRSIKLSSLNWLCLIGSNFPNGFCSIPL